MEKEFIPYEQALDLKELGFDEPSFGWFRSTLIPSNFTEFFLETEFGLNEGPSDWVNSNFLDNACSAPLYQQAFRFFREKYGLFFNIYSSDPARNDVYWNIYIFGKTKNRQDIKLEYVSMIYEEAELECLKKLIEIVKNKRESV